MQYSDVATLQVEPLRTIVRTLSYNKIILNTITSAITVDSTVTAIIAGDTTATVVGPLLRLLLTLHCGSLYCYAAYTTATITDTAADVVTTCTATASDTAATCTKCSYC